MASQELLKNSELGLGPLPLLRALPVHSEPTQRSVAPGAVHPGTIVPTLLSPPTEQLAGCPEHSTSPYDFPFPLLAEEGIPEAIPTP